MKNRKRLCLVLALVMIISSVFSVSTAEVEAAVTAKSLVKSALKYMKSYDSISYTYDSTYDRDGTIKTRTGMVTSDTKIDHGFYMDKTQSEGGWEEYEKKDKTYRKGYSSSEWKIYTDTDYDSKSVASYPSKKYIQYILGHLKSMKITSKGTNSYTITAKPNFSDTNVKKITLVIDKKEKCITSIKFSYKNYIGKYLNSEETYTVKNRITKWSNVSYGKTTIKLPSGL